MLIFPSEPITCPATTYAAVASNPKKFQDLKETRIMVRIAKPAQLWVASCLIPGAKKREQTSTAAMIITFKFIMMGMSLWQKPTAKSGKPTTCRINSMHVKTIFIYLAFNLGWNMSYYKNGRYTSSNTIESGIMADCLVGWLMQAGPKTDNW